MVVNVWEREKKWSIYKNMKKNFFLLNSRFDIEILCVKGFNIFICSYFSPFCACYLWICEFVLQQRWKTEKETKKKEWKQKLKHLITITKLEPHGHPGLLKINHGRVDLFLKWDDDHQPNKCNCILKLKNSSKFPKMKNTICCTLVYMKLHSCISKGRFTIFFENWIFFKRRFT